MGGYITHTRPPGRPRSTQVDPGRPGSPCYTDPGRCNTRRVRPRERLSTHPRAPPPRPRAHGKTTPAHAHTGNTRAPDRCDPRKTRGRVQRDEGHTHSETRILKITCTSALWRQHNQGFEGPPAEQPRIISSGTNGGIIHKANDFGYPLNDCPWKRLPCVIWSGLGTTRSKWHKCQNDTLLHGASSMCSSIIGEDDRVDLRH